MLFYSDLNRDSQRLTAFYQPQTKDLLTSINRTSVNLLIDGFSPVVVEGLSKSIDWCSKFSVTFYDTINSFTYFAIGESIQVYLTQTQTVVLEDGTSEEQTVTLYEEAPLTCTFGSANPTYSLTQSEYCF